MPILVGAVSVVLIAAILWTVRGARAKALAVAASESATVDTAEIESLTELELRRARRLDYPLSLIVFRLDKAESHNASPHEVLPLLDATSLHAASAGDPRSGAADAHGASSAPIVKLRSTDNVVFDRQQERFVMMLVGTEKQHAERIGARTAVSVQAKLHCSCSFGCAAFPADGFFAEDLLKRADPQAHSVLAPEGKAAQVA